MLLHSFDSLIGLWVILFVMDKTELLRMNLAKLIADNMGKQTGELFYDFYKDDDAATVTEGATALLVSLLGPGLTGKKIQEVKKSL